VQTFEFALRAFLCGKIAASGGEKPLATIFAAGENGAAKHNFSE